MVRTFVIAMANEADAVRPHLRPGDRLVVAGIGKVNAAAATMKAICDGATEIWNAGLAGGFDPAMNVGDIYAIESAVEYDFDLATVDGTRVGQLSERTSPYFPLAPLPRPVPSVLSSRILATGDRFNDSDADLSLFRELGATVRDMEGAAIAHVCELAGVPCRSFKCISNVIGKGAMTEQFKRNCGFCLDKLGQAAREVLA